MNDKIIRLYDEYTHRPMSRKAFMHELVRMTGSMAAAISALKLLENDYANMAATKYEGILTVKVEWTAPYGRMTGYLARPEDESKKRGAVIIIHENRGLNQHIEDVTRRAAVAGFVALAPDALSLMGGTPTDADEARNMISKLDPDVNLSNFVSAGDYLKSLKYCNGNIGCVGFCWGGYMANQLAVHMPDLRAAVAFYGRQPKTDDVPSIRAAIQLHYAGKDERVNAGIETYLSALQQYGKHYEYYMYEGVEHAFHNDTSAARYNEQAAGLAWDRTIRFLKTQLEL
ncbi:MAG: dienelactone hydrolase family protein [Saprospiraceae bacterium]|nr:dienelactone hydrolase family protein [Saprospiraceae bacterium]